MPSMGLHFASESHPLHCEPFHPWRQAGRGKTTPTGRPERRPSSDRLLERGGAVKVSKSPGTKSR